MALTYTEMINQSEDPNFRIRLKAALVQVIETPSTGPLQATPPAATDTSTAAQLDRRARFCLAGLDSAVDFYAPLVANQLIGKDTLLDEAVTTDGDLLSAMNARFADGLPSLG